MRKTTATILALAAAVGLAAITAAADGVFVRTGEGNVETIRLDELADGETRTFGEGDHRVTAARDGERITIRLHRGPAAEAETLDCTVGDDSCRVFISDDHGATVFVVGEPRGKVVKLLELSGASGVSVYECPEGDTTMRLSKDDTGPYFCPKHGLELEKATRTGIRRDVHVLVGGEADTGD